MVAWIRQGDRNKIAGCSGVCYELSSVAGDPLMRFWAKTAACRLTKKRAYYG